MESHCNWASFHDPSEDGFLWKYLETHSFGLLGRMLSFGDPRDKESGKFLHNCKDFVNEVADHISGGAMPHITTIDAILAYIKGECWDNIKEKAQSYSNFCDAAAGMLEDF